MDEETLKGYSETSSIFLGDSTSRNYFNRHFS